MQQQAIHSDQAPAAIGPYSPGVSWGDLIFASGQIPYTPAGQISASIEEQTRQSLKNLQAVLEAGGSSLSQVLKTTVFVADMAQFSQINAVYAEFFSAPFPARSCVQAAALPKGVGVEIEAIAWKK